MKTIPTDFEEIREAIKSHLRDGDSEFKDWDFEGSTLSIILDTLAWNTHYNAMLVQQGFNESFLSTAQLRKNVVARAQDLSYVPRSKQASTVRGTVRVELEGVIPNLKLLKGAKFTASIDSNTFGFVAVTPHPYTSIEYTPTKTFVFEDVLLYQGDLRHKDFVFNSSDSDRRFKIPTKNVDLRTLEVRVYESDDSSYTTWTRYSDFSDIVSASSKVYYIEEDSDGYFNVFFNDMTALPDSGTRVRLEYVETSAAPASANDIPVGSFSYVSGALPKNLGYPASTPVSFIGDQKSSGGAVEEDIESVRLSAPITFGAQNRMVTAADYESLIRSNISVETISVWGGEDNLPHPEFGKVFIAVKPEGAASLSDVEKDQLKALLRKKNVMTVTPEFVDPEYMTLGFNVSFRYNSDLNVPEGTLKSEVYDAIVDYGDNVLEKFNTSFRHSKLVEAIVDSHPAVLSTVIDVFARKDITISASSAASALIDFGFTILNTSAITSSEFTYDGAKHHFSTTTTGNTLRLVRSGSGAVVNSSVGSVNRETGEVTLSSPPALSTTQTVSFFAYPENDDIEVSNQTLLTVDTSRISTTAVSA